jgi:Flp pilus assembly protein TadG
MAGPPIATPSGSARQSLLRRVVRGQGGTAAVEFALIAMPLLVMLFGAFEIGRLMWIQNALHFSVEEAARCASVNSTSCGSASAIQSYAADRSGALFTAANFSVSTPTCGNQVSATYPISLTVPYVTFAVTLTAQACFPK